MMKLIDLIAGWFRNPKFENRHAILFAGIFLAIGLIISAVLSRSIWSALTAIGTIGVVLYAVYREEYLIHRKRPILELSLFEPEPPHLIKVPEVNPQTGAESQGYYVTLKLTNVGKSIARNAQPLITAKGQYMYDDGWKTQSGWMPISIKWCLDEWSHHVSGKPTEERDLIPERPYLFHALGVSSTRPDHMNIYPIVIPRHQHDKYTPGKYCFEITVHAVGVETLKKYVHVEWRREQPDTFTEIPERLTVFLRDNPPWQTNSD